MVEGNYKNVSTMAKYLSHSIEYGCSSCLRSFPKADELQRHLMDLHACHLYRCSICKLIFDSKVRCILKRLSCNITLSFLHSGGNSSSFCSETQQRVYRIQMQTMLKFLF